MFGKAIKNIGRGTGRSLKPAPIKPTPVKPTPVRPTPVKPTPVRPTPSPGLPSSPDRGNVEFNYRGIPGLVNATAPMPNLGGGMPPSSPPSGGATGSTGFKSGPGNLPFMSDAIRAGAAPAGGFGAGFGGGAGAAPGNLPFMSDAIRAGAPGNPTGVKLPPGGLARPVLQGMKKGGSVKASKAPKASSASKRGDGIATKGKTKGRFV